MRTFAQHFGYGRMQLAISSSRKNCILLSRFSDGFTCDKRHQGAFTELAGV
jgi:hypothetical protein